MVTVSAGTQPQFHIVTASGTDVSTDEAAGSERHLIGMVAHAGLGISRPCGAPTRTTLRKARGFGAEAVEVDICTTADGALVLQHDLSTARGIPLITLALRELRRRRAVPMLRASSCARNASTRCAG